MLCCNIYWKKALAVFFVFFFSFCFELAPNTAASSVFVVNLLSQSFLSVLRVSSCVSHILFPHSSPKISLQKRTTTTNICFLLYYLSHAFLLLLLLLLFLLPNKGISVLQQVRGWDITVPKTVTAVEGSCVVVPCHTKPHSRVKWYQYHATKYPVVYDRDQPHKVEHQFRGRTSVVGKAADGNCTLVINDVRRTDNNIQVYVWINPDSVSTQKFYLQTVTISVIGK